MSTTLTPPKSARSITSGPLVVFVAWLAAFLPMLDTSIVNMSMPQLASALHLPLSGLGWVTNSYLLPLVVTIPVAGRIGDLTGRKRLLISGASLFAAASLLAAIAGSAIGLLIGRALQGVGAGVLVTLSMAVVTTRFPAGPQRARALGWYMSGPAFGGAMGPLAGFALTAIGGWRLMFAAQLPLALLVAALTTTLSIPQAPLLPQAPPMPQAPRVRRRLDLAGMALATLALGGLNIALLQSPSWGWLSLPAISGWLLFVVSVFGFIHHERRTSDPMLNLKVFASRAFLAAGVAGAAVWFGIISGFMLLPIYLQDVRGIGSLHASLLVAAWPLGALAMYPFAGALTLRIGVARAMLSTVGVTAIAAVSMIGFGAATPDMIILIVGVTLGIATAVAQVATASRAVAGFADTDAGVASGVFNTVRQIGSSLGGALPMSVLAAAAPHGLIGAGALPATHAAFGVRAIVLAIGLIVVAALLRPSRPKKSAAR